MISSKLYHNKHYRHEHSYKTTKKKIQNTYAIGESNQGF